MSAHGQPGSAIAISIRLRQRLLNSTSMEIGCPSQASTEAEGSPHPGFPSFSALAGGPSRFAEWYAIGMNALLARITIDPAICHGKPCVRGLRYPVETLLELLSSGMTIDEILADYEDLEREDLLAVLAYAARLARTRRLQPVNP